MTTRSLRLRAKSALLSATLATSVLVPLTASPALADTNGIITGYVREVGNPGGTPPRSSYYIGNICVDAFDQFGNWVARDPDTVTDLDGTGNPTRDPDVGTGRFRITGLPQGSYYLRASDCGSQRAPSTAPNDNVARLPEDEYATGWFAGSGQLGARAFDQAAAVDVSLENSRNSSASIDAGDIVLAPGATINGSIVQDAPAQPLPNVCVQVVDSATGALIAETRSSDSASTADQGRFAITSLWEGDYKLFFRTDRAKCGNNREVAGASAANNSAAPAADIPATSLNTHLSEYWENAATIGAATKITLPRGGGVAAPLTVSLAKAPEQGISGTVLTDNGSAAGSVCVSAHTSRTSGVVGTTVTPDNGSFQLKLPVGTYILEVHERCITTQQGSNDDTYVAEVHPDVHYKDAVSYPTTSLDDLGVASTATLTTVQVNAGAFTSVAPRIAKRATLTGLVTDSKSPATELGGVCVLLTDQSGRSLAANLKKVTPTSPASGAFTFTGLRPATYTVEYRTDDSAAGCTATNHLGEWHDGATSLSGATPVTLTSAQSRTLTTATLRGVGDKTTVSGRATRSGAGVSGICVRLRDLDFKAVNAAGTTTPITTTTGADGTYSLADVPPGQYRVEFSRPVSGCGDATNGDDVTDAGYVATTYNGSATRFDAAGIVTVGTNPVTNVDAVVERGGRLVVPVSFSTGDSQRLAAVSQAVCVEVLNASQQVVRSIALPGVSDAIFEGLPAGTYKVRSDDAGTAGKCANVPFVDSRPDDDLEVEYHLDQRTFANAQSVEVTAGAARSIPAQVMDGELKPSGTGTGSLSGYVRGADLRVGLEGIEVHVFKATDDPAIAEPFKVPGPSGSLVVPTTSRITYDRPFLDCDSTDPAGIQPRRWDPADDPTTPDCEYVDSSGATPAQAKRLPVVRFDPTTTLGYWKIEGLAPGDYKVRFVDPQGTNASEWYRSGKTFASAFTVKVVAGRDVELGELATDLDNFDADRRQRADNPDPNPGDGADPEQFLPLGLDRNKVNSEAAGEYDGDGDGNADRFSDRSRFVKCTDQNFGRCLELVTQLAPAGNMTGRVSAADTGAALANVRVDLLSEETGNIVDTAFTGSDGRYQMPGLAAGGYKVKFTPSNANYGVQFYDAKRNFGAANVVTIAAQSTRSAINASLPANKPPVAGDDKRQAEVNKATVFADLLSNDVDPEGDTLVISAVTQPTHGTTVLNQDGTVTYTSGKDNMDDATFTYTVKDPSGLTSTATVTVDVVGQIVGLRPIARDDEATTPQNTAVMIDVLRNDEDPDGTQPLVITSVTTPFHGTASVVNGMIRYTPTSGFRGLDQFVYEVTDSQGFTANAKVTVAVNAASGSGASQQVAAGGTVATDGTTASASNPIITTVTTPNAGTVTIDEQQTNGGSVSDITLVPWRVLIEAPNATAGNPLTITFRLDGSLLQGEVPQRAIRVLRNNTLVGDCLGSRTASPDPCISGHRMVGDDLLLTIRTSKASTWNFGFDNDAVVDRAAGTSRVGTAVQVSRQAFSPADVDTVVVARADAYPDALAGAPLAKQLGAPILLTDKGSLSTETRDEINRLGPNRVVILGGTGAVSTTVENQIRGLSTVNQVDRIAGRDRFETAAAIARQLGSYDTAYVVEGADANAARGWPDAVAVASLAAFEGRPILLVTTEELPAATRSALSGLREAVVIGGPRSVSTAVVQRIDEVVGVVGRVSGADRFETSYQVAQRALASGLTPSSVWIATGLNFPDALAAGPAVAAEGGILLLVHGKDYDASPAVERFLRANRTRIESVTIAGGSGAVSFGAEVRIGQATQN